jgi:hypothetical protein
MLGWFGGLATRLLRLDFGGQGCSVSVIQDKLPGIGDIAVVLGRDCFKEVLGLFDASEPDLSRRLAEINRLARLGLLGTAPDV